jgi:hypothetical protein
VANQPNLPGADYDAAGRGGMAAIPCCYHGLNVRAMVVLAAHQQVERRQRAQGTERKMAVPVHPTAQLRTAALQKSRSCSGYCRMQKVNV